jgi:hypothetical protein
MAMTNGRCRMHGGMSPGAPKVNRNAYKHRRYTADAIANRREITPLLRAMKALASTGERKKILPRSHFTVATIEVPREFKLSRLT